jgi:hypothetical protein
MTDNSDDDISQVIALIRKIVADAYRRGQDDALARVMLAAQGELHTTATVQRPSGNGVDLPKRRPGGQPGAKRATRGSVRKYVNRVLTGPNYQGANYDGIVDMIAELGGTDIAPASVRNFLRSSEKRGEVRRQNDLWFPVRPPWAREEENRAVGQSGESQPESDER